MTSVVGFFLRTDPFLRADLRGEGDGDDAGEVNVNGNSIDDVMALDILPIICPLPIRTPDIGLADPDTILAWDLRSSISFVADNN